MSDTSYNYTYSKPANYHNSSTIDDSNFDGMNSDNSVNDDDDDDSDDDGSRSSFFSALRIKFIHSFSFVVNLKFATRTLSSQKNWTPAVKK